MFERALRRYFVMVGAAALVALTVGATKADQLLANGGFTSWSGGTPGGWTLAGGSVADGGGVAQFTGSGTLQQTVAVAPGGTYTASFDAQLPGGGAIARARIRWFTSQFAPSGEVAESGNSTTWSRISVTGLAPPNAAFATFVIQVEAGPGAITLVDNARLDGPSAPPPPTATPTATIAPPTATRTATKVPSASTSTPTKTPTTSASTTTSTPGSTSPSSTNSPTLVPATVEPTTVIPGYGGLLSNGNFERVDGGSPVGWAKFGGTMGLTPDAYAGSWSVTLASDRGGTRWIHQGARVTAGQWYAASGVARIASGAGDAFFRLSWYASPDGSGTTLSQVDGASVTAGGWSGMASGAVRAPAGANSVRVRLMLRAGGDATALFDNVALVETVAPPPTVATGGSGGGGTGGGRTGGSTGGAQGFVTVPYAGGLTLAISEVLADPIEAGRDAPYEWVEIVNFGTAAISTEGWRIADARESDGIPAVEVPPGGFLVIAGSAAAFEESVMVVRVADGEIGAGLNNAGEAVSLVAPDGSTVDLMSFGEDTSVFDPAPPAPGSGATIGVRIPGADPDQSNWAITVRPTPGEANMFPAVAPNALLGGADSDETSDNAGDDTVEVIEANGESVAPWVLLAFAAGIGAAGAGMIAQRHAPKIAARVRRGR